MRSSRSREAAERAQERRDREDTAARLRSVVPTITSLRLELTEVGGAHDGVFSQYSKLVVVDRAPALFEFGCAEADCDGPPHDLTRAIMAALNDHETRFTGVSVCHGHRRNSPCQRRLQYSAVATYEDVASTPPP